MEYGASIVVTFVTVLVHECGHYFAARFCNVPVEAVHIGVGPKLCVGRFDRTQWVLRLFPFGGSVSLSQTSETAAVWQQVLIIISGPIANIWLGAVYLVGLYFSGLGVSPALVTLNGAYGWMIPCAALTSFFTAALNLLPLPPLDGGRLAQIAVEAALRSELPRAVQGALERTGIAILSMATLLAVFACLSILLR